MEKQLSIPEIAKRVCKAVITIVISKNLPKLEGFYLMPYQGRGLMMPKFNAKKKESTKIGGGSGFIVSSDGYLITSQHVVADKTAEYTVVLEPNKKYLAKVLARDPIHDIAILKIAAKNLPYIETDKTNKVELGQDVVAIGNALGEFSDTVSSGIVSGLSRLIQAQNHATNHTESLSGLIQTDAAINPGNSGGPLVNRQGKVIAINTAMIMGAQNIGFAIPIRYALKDLTEVKKYGKIKIPFLGIKYIILDKEMAARNNIAVDYGALIIRETLGEPAIASGSAAERAKLKEFDIVLEVNNKKITIKNPLSNILQKCKIGEKIDLKILRGKKRIVIRAILTEKK